MTQAIEPALLAAKGSLFLTRPSLDAYAARRADLEAGAAELFDAVSGPDRHPPALCAARRAPGPDGSGGAQDHRLERVVAVAGSSAPTALALQRVVPRPERGALRTTSGAQSDAGWIA